MLVSAIFAPSWHWHHRKTQHTVEPLGFSADNPGHQPVPLIIDTDMGGGACHDVDDVVAVCMANALADRGEIELLAVVVDTLPANGVGVVSVLNHYYGRDAVPIGAYRGGELKYNYTQHYVNKLVNEWPSPVKSASQVPDSVDVYRRTLAAQPDHSVAIASIGSLNNIADLMRSQPDVHSPLPGHDLLAQKVKQLSIMGGQYPSSAKWGWCECNFCASRAGVPTPDHVAASQTAAFVTSSLPANIDVVYLGFEVGVYVKTGAPLTTCAPASNPCRQALIDFNGPGKGRFSWDPMATLVAARGAEAAGCSRSNSPGRNSINPRTGDNAWAVGSPVNQSYLLLKDGRHARQAVDELLCMPPRHTTPSGRSLASAPSDATPRSPTLPPSSPVEPPQIPSSSDGSDDASRQR